MPTRVHSVRPAATTVALVVLLCFAGAARATSLTFDFFSDAAKTTRISNTSGTIQNYGDNVSDFDPATQVNGVYAKYGADGGITPNVTVEYRYYNFTNSADDALQNVWRYHSQPSDNFGDLPAVIYTTANSSSFGLEIRLIPAAGKTVTLESFDLAGYRNNQSVTNIMVMEDLTTTPWNAGATTVSGTTHNHFTPNVTVYAGHYLSLIYGPDAGGLRGISNVVFSQGLAPEPSSLGLLAVSGLLIGQRGRRKA